MADKEKFLNDVGLSHVITKTKELLDGKVDVDSSVVYASEDGAVEVDILVEDVQAALLKKVDKVDGMGLSANDFTDEYKITVDQLASADLRPEGSVYTDFDSSTEVAEVESIDASSLEGHAASYFATADSVTNITKGVTTVGNAASATNASKLGGESANAWQAKIDVEKARIDNLIALEESSELTDVEKEVADIKVGADGVTYGSAGTAVRTQINSLKSDLSKVAELDVTWHEGGYISYASGNVAGHESYKYTDFIPLVNGILANTLVFKTKIFANTAIALYDKNYFYIGNIGTDSTSLIEYSGTVTGSKDAYYVRFTCEKNYTPSVWLSLKDTKTIIIDTFITTEEIVDKAITPIKTSFLVHDETTNFIRGFLVEKSYVEDGIIKTTSNNLYVTEKVYLKGGESYYWGGLFGGYSAFYDENDNVLEAYGFTDRMANPFTVPDGASYGRFTTPDGGNLEDAWISLTNEAPLSYAVKLDESIKVKTIIDLSEVENPCDYIGDDICAFTKCLCIGDSLTAGTMNADGSTADGLNYISIDKYSFPRNLERLTGMEVVNMGLGGRSSAEWYSEKQNEDLSGYDIAIIQLGVNDGARYNGWTETSVNGFTNIIDKLKNENKNIKIFVSTIMPATSYSSTLLEEISEGIRTLVSSLNDENVILVDLAVYGHTKDSSAYNCGHLSAYGYYRLAKDYKAFISHYMNTHKEVFKEIQFIGTDYVSGY